MISTSLQKPVLLYPINEAEPYVSTSNGIPVPVSVVPRFMYPTIYLPNLHRIKSTLAQAVFLL